MKMALRAHVLVGLLAITPGLSAIASDPCGAGAILEQRELAERYFPGWKVVSTTDLSSEDRELWKRTYPDKCPGVALGAFEKDDGAAVAVTLLRRKRSGLHQMLAVRAGSKWLPLFTPEEVDRISVVRTVALSPQGYRTGSSSSPAAAIGYEVIEAGMLLFVWKDGRYVEVQASE